MIDLYAIRWAGPGTVARSRAGVRRGRKELFVDRSITDVLLMQYESFTASEKKIVDYVLSHQRESQHMSITELSAACSVAISTVSGR